MHNFLCNVRLQFITPELIFLDLQAKCRYQKWSQSWKSDHRQVCIDPYVQTGIILIFTKLFTQIGNLRSLEIVIFRSTSLKLGLLNRNLYVDFKNGPNLENPITNESVDPYFPFLDTLYVYLLSLSFILFPMSITNFTPYFVIFGFYFHILASKRSIFR